MSANLKRVLGFLRRNAMLCASALAALITAFIVPPDSEYLNYADVDTLICLFCILSVVCGLRHTGFFERAAQELIKKFKSPRLAIGSLVLATAVISMFATNDMALIMMLPLSTAVLGRAGWIRLLPVTFILQGLAANLCGMIMPFGNPQNLYLYSFYSISLADFAQAMALPFGCSVLLLAICVVLFARMPKVERRGIGNGAKKVSEEADGDFEDSVYDGKTRLRNRYRALILGLLLVLTICSVFRIVASPIALVAVVVVLLVFDVGAFRIDYGLLATFLFFFIFAGNMARIPAVSEFLEGLLSWNALVLSAGLSQIISNVPAAILLSHFTDAWQPLLVGVNVGGAGTLVGSLASLITLQNFMAVSRMYSFSASLRKALSVKRFIAVFSAFNFAFLLILLAACSL